MKKGKKLSKEQRKARKTKMLDKTAEKMMFNIKRS